MAFCPSVPLRQAPLLSPARSRPVRCSADLLVVGAGELGMRVAHLWRKNHPRAEIVCATSTDARHAEIEEAGFSPAVSSSLNDPAARVVFCAPPRKLPSAEYAACVRAAANLAQERFVLTTSTGIFADAPVVTEDSPLSDTERATRLIDAEREALARENGTVLRLAGLYSLERGAHAFWLRREEIGGGPEGMLNLVHYDDAARAVVCALEGEAEDVHGKRFLIVDEEAVSRKAMLEATLKHPLYAQYKMPRFGEGGSKKRVDGSWSKNVLKWEPKYKRFADFMEMDAARNKTSSR